MTRGLGNSKYLDIGQILVPKGRDGVGQEGDGQEDQESLISLEIRCDAVAIGILKDIEAPDKKQSCTEVDSQSDGDVASNIRPATDPRGDATTPERRQNECLVINTTGSWINRGNFSKGDGDTENQEGDEDPTPDNIGGATGGEGIVEGGGETVRDGGKNEAHESNLPDRTIACKFRHVAHILEGSIRIARVGASSFSGDGNS